MIARQKAQRTARKGRRRGLRHTVRCGPQAEANGEMVRKDGDALSYNWSGYAMSANSISPIPTASSPPTCFHPTGDAAAGGTGAARHTPPACRPTDRPTKKEIIHGECKEHSHPAPSTPPLRWLARVTRRRKQSSSARRACARVGVSPFQFTDLCTLASTIPCVAGGGRSHRTSRLWQLVSSSIDHKSTWA